MGCNHRKPIKTNRQSRPREGPFSWASAPWVGGVDAPETVTAAQTRNARRTS
nr:MAG TPA: hypothetical protein [Caudoviricetes sp.]